MLLLDGLVYQKGLRSEPVLQLAGNGTVNRVMWPRRSTLSLITLEVPSELQGTDHRTVVATLWVHIWTLWVQCSLEGVSLRQVKERVLCLEVCRGYFSMFRWTWTRRICRAVGYLQAWNARCSLGVHWQLPKSKSICQPGRECCDPSVGSASNFLPSSRDNLQPEGN